MTTTKSTKFLDSYRVITVTLLIIIVFWMGYITSNHSNNDYAISYGFKLTVIGIFLILAGAGKVHYLFRIKQTKEAKYAFYGMIIHMIILFAATIIYTMFKG